MSILTPSYLSSILRIYQNYLVSDNSIMRRSILANMPDILRNCCRTSLNHNEPMVFPFPVSVYVDDQEVYRGRVVPFRELFGKYSPTEFSGVGFEDSEASYFLRTIVPRKQSF